MSLSAIFLKTILNCRHSRLSQLENFVGIPCCEPLTVTNQISSLKLVTKRFHWPKTSNPGGLYKLLKKKNPTSAFLVTEGYTFMSERRVRSFGWRPPTLIDQLKGEKYGKYYSPQSVFIIEKHRAMLIYSIHLNTFKSLLCVHYFEDISTYMKERKLQDVRSWKWDNCKFAFRSVPHWWNFHRQIDRKVKLNL